MLACFSVFSASCEKGVKSAARLSVATLFDCKCKCKPIPVRTQLFATLDNNYNIYATESNSPNSLSSTKLNAIRALTQHIPRRPCFAWLHFFCNEIIWAEDVLKRSRLQLNVQHSWPCFHCQLSSRLPTLSQLCRQNSDFTNFQTFSPKLTSSSKNVQWLMWTSLQPSWMPKLTTMTHPRVSKEDTWLLTR